MVAVFAIFATLSLIDLQEFGVGLAAAVLIDATLIRGIVLPASMKLLGRWNWYMPSELGLAAGARRGPHRPRGRPGVTPPTPSSARPDGPPSAGRRRVRGSRTGPVRMHATWTARQHHTDAR